MLLERMLVSFGETLPRPGHLGEALEFGAGFAVIRIETERDAQRAARTDRIISPLLPESGGFTQHRDLLGRCLGERVALFVQSDQTPPIVGAFVERAQDLDDAFLQ